MSKKTFKTNLERIENPALQFISTIPNEDQTERKDRDIITPEGYKVVPEAKSKRLQLLIQPSLYKRVKKKADANGTSVNDTIHNILSRALRGESTDDFQI